MADQESNQNNEIWKIAELIKKLEAARGNGASLISLIMSPDDQISRVTEMLGDEFGTASNIIDSVNHQSVLDAVTTAQQRLMLYNKLPPNGLILYTGTIVTYHGNKKVEIEFEPFKPMYKSLYLRDNKFDTEALNELLRGNFQSDDKFGFIVMDCKGTLFETLSGNTREVLHKFTVDLPREHGRGGQSALQFAVKRYNYVRKTAELATQFFINPATSQPNVSGLILAGSADFETELIHSDKFDDRLRVKILNVVDVSYGGENGFNKAIRLSAEILSDVEFIQEKRLLGKYFEGINQDYGNVFGVDDTLIALSMGGLETLILWKNLHLCRYVLKNSVTSEIFVKYLNKEEEGDPENFKDSATAAELEVEEKIPFIKFFAEELEHFDCVLSFVTNKSQEGSQFCRVFGGIGGIRRL